MVMTNDIEMRNNIMSIDTEKKKKVENKRINVMVSTKEN